jgi:hypothetical protein
MDHGNLPGKPSLKPGVIPLERNAQQNSKETTVSVRFFTSLIIAAACTGILSSNTSAGERKPAHTEYIKTLWDFVQTSNYTEWKVDEDFAGVGVGPRSGQKTFASNLGDWKHGSIAISETWRDGELAGLTLFARQKPGYSERNNDWYWVHFLADGTVIAASPDKEAHGKAGFVTEVVDGRLWVFEITSAAAAEFFKSGEPAKSVTHPGAGPGGMTVRSGDAETIEAYLATKDGFFVWPVDGRLWVFKSDSKERAGFLAGGELAKSVTRPGAGPNGVTLRSEDSETIDLYVAAKAGFATSIVDGRLWVFKADAAELEEFKANSELAKSVTRPGAGQGGMTIRSADSETIDAYLTAKDGFETFIVDGRVWVFRTGAEELAEFKSNGELAKSVTRPGAGPGGMTIRSADSVTIDLYLN